MKPAKDKQAELLRAFKEFLESFRQLANLERQQTERLPMFIQIAAEIDPAFAMELVRNNGPAAALLEHCEMMSELYHGYRQILEKISAAAADGERQEQIRGASMN
jgi:hypothetical protein